MDNKLIYKGGDEYGPIRIEEADEAGIIYRFMVFGDGASQSAVRMDDTNTLIFPYIKQMITLFEEEETIPNNCLILGLGGGTIPSWINTNHPEVNLKVVELRELVYKVSKEYFKLSEEIDVSIEDGVRYPFKLNRRKEDLIMIDMFGNNGMPSEMKSAGFVRGVHSILNKGGTVVMNVWPKDIEDGVYTGMWQKTFKEVKLWKVYGGNHVLVAKR